VAGFRAPGARGEEDAVGIKGVPEKRRPERPAVPTAVAEPSFLDELRVVEKLLPVSPGEISQRVLGSHFDEANLKAAERLNELNMRYYETILRPLVDEWIREVHLRRVRQMVGFAVSCGALAAGCFAAGIAAYALVAVGMFGFVTAVSSWFGSTAAGFGERLTAKLGPLLLLKRGVKE
jgi:hypothetical protein